MPTRLWLVAALVCAALLGLTLVRAWRLSCARARAARAVALVTAILWLALGPQISETQAIPAEQEILLVVDDSASMRLPHASGDASRFAIAQQKADLFENRLRATLGDTGARIRAIALSGAPLSRVTEPKAPETRFVAPLAEHVEQSERHVSAIVLFSDGATQEAEPSDAAKMLPAPVYGVAVGEAWPDVSIERVRHGEFAFIKTETTVEVDVRLQDNKERLVEVSLDDGQTLLGQVAVRVKPNEVQSVPFRIRAERVGPMTLQASVRPLPNEAYRQNNSRASSLQILRDKTRVLHVLGAPGIDGRFVREALLSQRNVDVVSFFILRTPTNEAVVSEQELSLIPFPVQQLFTTELKNFDAVILQNFDPRPFGMQPFVGNLAEAVRQGLGLCMVGGPQSFAEGGWHESPLADVLPVVSRPGSRTAGREARLPRFAAQAGFHPLFQGFAAPGAPLSPVPAALHAFHDVGPLLPGATGLLWVDGASPGHATPVLAARDVGEGRVVSLATNESWRWAFAPEEAGRQWLFRLWHNMLAYLSKDAGDARLLIGVEAEGAESAGLFRASVRVLDREWQARAHVPIDVRVTPVPGLLEEGAPVPPWQTRVTSHADGVAHIERDALPPGRYRIEAQTGGEDPLLTRTTIAIEPSEEQADVAPHPERLEALAEATGGTLVIEASQLPVMRDAGVPAVRSVSVQAPLWPRPWLAALLLFAVVAHWGWARRVDFAA